MYGDENLGDFLMTAKFSESDASAIRATKSADLHGTMRLTIFSRGILQVFTRMQELAGLPFDGAQTRPSALHAVLNIRV
jgi:hypothetical protein